MIADTEAPDEPETLGTPVYEFDVPAGFCVYAHAGGLLTVQHVLKDRWVGVNVIGMTDDEIARSVATAVALLERAPVNRAQRRAMH